MKLLQDRVQAPKLYSEGDYQPLEIQGDMADHLLAYGRQWRHEKIVVIVPRLWASLATNDEPSLDLKVWNGANIALPHGRWANVITGRTLDIAAERTSVADILEAFPFAVLRSSEDALQEGL
jgi:(1->4)-alpha-D-glucan 1-alpha-D-glucosylmutase